VHGLVVQKLIETCLSKQLLVRGATSVGKYNTKQSVFVGPAIDEAAAWHEMGQEVGVFLTPSTLFKYRSNLDSAGMFIERTMKFKGQELPTYCVLWRDDRNNFTRIAEKQSPISPDIANKYINTIKYLKELKNKGKDVSERSFYQQLD